MKKYILSIITLAALARMSFAQQPAPAAAPKAAKHIAGDKKPAAAKREAVKPEVVTGVISALDTAKSEITVKNEKGVDRILGADIKRIVTLKVGQNVRITVKNNRADNIKAIKKHDVKKA